MSSEDLIREEKTENRDDDYDERETIPTQSHIHSGPVIPIERKNDLWESSDDDTPLKRTVKRMAYNALIASPPYVRNFEPTELHIAVRDNSVEIAALLLDAGAVIDATNRDGKTSLHLAIEAGNAEMFSLLLDRGASVTIRDRRKETLLYTAVSSNNIAFIEPIINKLKLMDDKFTVNVSRVDLSTPLMKAATFGNLDVMRLLVEAGADVNQLNDDNKSALHYVANNNCIECFEYLYQFMSPESKEVNCNRAFTCLQHSYFENKSCSILRQLYRMGQDPNMCLAPVSKHFCTPLYFHMRDTYGCECLRKYYSRVSVLACVALYYDRDILLDIISHGGHINSTSLKSISPLHAAVFVNNLEMVKVLIEHGANPNHPKNLDPKKCVAIIKTAFKFPNILVELLKAGGDIRQCYNRTIRCQISLTSLKHVGCLNHILNAFSCRPVSLYYRLVSTSRWLLLMSESNETSKLLTKVNPDIYHSECSALVSGVDSMSLQHQCRLQIVRAVLTANNWMPLQQCLNRLPVPKLIIDFLLYRYMK